jgi:ankyrin repeat protein
MDPDDQVYEACEQGDVEALQRLFPDDPTQWRDSWGGSLLHVAVQTPHLPVLDWLLTFPIDVNMPTAHGYTPLMRACVFGQKAMARRLLDQGAHVQATDRQGRTVLHYACFREWVNGVAWLLEQEANPEARDEEGRLPEDECPVDSPHRATLLDLLDAARQGCGLK